MVSQTTHCNSDAHRNLAASRLSIREAASPYDRARIYQLRYRIYCNELGQHPENAHHLLSDALDRFNIYVLAEIGTELVGCISVTPPSSQCGRPRGHHYSVDKYLNRTRMPASFDDGLYELRLLTVAGPYRQSILSGLLMYAALRWVESRGGRQIVALGRTQILPLYRKVGLQPLGISVRSGAVRFNLMPADVKALRKGLSRYSDKLQRLHERVDWQLNMPIDPQPDALVGTRRAIAAHENGRWAQADGNPTEPACYHGGGFFGAIGERLDTLARRHHIINADVLDAWFDPSQKVIAALKQHFPWLLRTSPPTHSAGMAEAIAEARKMNPNSILCGEGSSDLIFLTSRHLLTPSARTLILDATYGEYAHVLEQVIGCQVDRFTLAREHNYELDIDRLGSVLQGGYDLVVLVNPNSPTGQFADPVAIRQLACRAPARTLFWIDETYVEYAGSDRTMARLAAHSANMLVCKSMSKVYALSGVRAAYLCASPTLLASLRAISPPWAVSLPAQLAAITALSDPGYYQARWQQSHRLRASLAEALQQHCGLTVVPGVANFLLAHLPPTAVKAHTFVQACRQHDLFIRDVSSMGASMREDAVRIAVKDAKTNRQIVRTLRAVLNQLTGRPPPLS